jgi:hypothetical protein
MADMVHISKVLANVIASLQELQASITEPEKEANKPQVTITLEEVRRALAELSRDGFTAQVRELLMKYGAKKLSEVNPDKYEALMQEAGEIRGK